ncbi:hypothetical protein Rleg4DRAFT_6093 [Rhizobium leguminosarum bv. trifolii WSM2297]|uniref:Integral membrane protein n=1 Tax=Rhizobium leguminosarum bv. trifolii WSM2297 TaxID=754762 RepID=J0L256_RHILT|nr:hypothetical protein [Rhizobium leguminosarum]EJC84279.1 hypothetical protein Rleg4DRAFT_6093 [Rhizobium leguminosarum bv. trifolii WSM2297]
MQLSLIIAMSVHILAATFWAGSTFALARTAGLGSEQLFRSQLFAAAIAIGAGGYLWHTLHEGSFGTAEQLLGAGAVAAILALGIQATVVGGALRRLRKAGGDYDASVRPRVAVAQRGAAILLAIAAVTMAAARYA